MQRDATVGTVGTWPRWGRTVPRCPEVCVDLIGEAGATPGGSLSLGAHGQRAVTRPAHPTAKPASSSTPKMPTAPLPSRTLDVLDRGAAHTFKAPVKCINDGDHVAFFLTSRAYADIMTFIFQLNVAMLPRKAKEGDSDAESSQEWTLNQHHVVFPPIVQNLAKLLDALAAIIDEAPPDPGPRRFGNISFRRWYDLVRERVPGLLDQHLPAEVIMPSNPASDVTAKHELEAYLIGSFGSSQRLDYGTGHELSFLAFLGCLWKLGGFPASTDGEIERAIVLGVVEPCVT